MVWKALKLGALTVGGGAIIGGLVLGSDLGSFVRSSCKSVRVAVKDNIPIDFQLRRARDLLDETGPEMKQNVRLMAEQEVEIASLKGDIELARQNLSEEKLRVAKLRDCLTTAQTSFSFGDFTYGREQLKQELARRFNLFKEGESALEGKQQLLTNRQKALAAAMQAMETARVQRAALQSQIEALEGQYRLVEATSTGTNVQIDNSKLAQAQKVIAEVRKQLDISEHMLAHEAKFTQPMQIDVIDEKDLLTQVDSHLSGKPQVATAPEAHTQE
jgi:hypothetical protein